MMRTSAHAREVQLAAPAREQRLAEPTVDRVAKLGVLGNDRLSLQSRLLEDGGVTQQVGDAELRQAGLARAEELAGTAQLQVDLGDRKSTRLNSSHTVIS